MAKAQAGQQTGKVHSYTPEYVTLVKQANPTLTDAEIDLYLYRAEQMGADVLMGQLYATVWGEGAKRKLSFQTSIDMFRLIAERTGEYRGQQGPFWCGPDGEWQDVWVSNQPPAAAKVGVLRSTFDEPMFAPARYASYQQTGGLGLWQKMPDVMIAKVAEALALRRAFPQQLGGVYAHEEMDQARNGDANGDTAAAEVKAAETKEAKQEAKEERKEAKAAESTPAHVTEIGTLYKALGLPREDKNGGPDTKGLFARYFAERAQRKEHEQHLTAEEAANYILTLRRLWVSQFAHRTGLTNTGIAALLTRVAPEAGFEKEQVDGVNIPELTSEQWPMFMRALRIAGATVRGKKAGKSGGQIQAELTDLAKDGEGNPTTEGLDAYIKGLEEHPAAESEQAQPAGAQDPLWQQDARGGAQVHQRTLDRA